MQPPPRLEQVSACVFDAYGTLFDTGSVARGAQAALGERWEAVSDLWRAKQLQYTWLRGLGGRHADFWQVTGEALDFALDSQGIQQPGLRDHLMELYLSISAFPEVPAVLQALRAQGQQVAILSNGTPGMLAAAVDHAGLDGLFDAVLSVESVGVYKPHPKVYALASERLGLPAERLCFLSSNGWDAWSAKASGLRVLWVNRTGQPPERLPMPPDGELRDLTALPGLVTC